MFLVNRPLNHEKYCPTKTGVVESGTNEQSFLYEAVDVENTVKIKLCPSLVLYKAKNLSAG
jgi:hypothetical protein